MTPLIRAVIALIAATCISPCARGDDAGSGAPSAVSAKPIPIALQPWQQRRKEFANTVQGLREGKESARKDFDAILTEFETRILSRTPIENMEILGVFYVPKDGVEKSLPVVVMNAVLGWYDALRFASESGQAELVNNEGFFKKPFVLGGRDMGSRAAKFLEENPERTAQLVVQGISFAEKYRDIANYDRQWPTAYGLERMMCAMTQGPCKTPSALPKEQWDKAWLEAKQRVTLYYQPKKPDGSNANSLPRPQ